MGASFAIFRFLDRFVGGLACAALTPIVWLLHELSGDREAPARLILVIKFFGMGSILRGWPLFEAVRRRHPGAAVHLLTFSSNAEIARRMGVFEEILEVRSSGALGLVRDMFHRIAQISTRRYDIVIDMEFFSNFATLLTALTRAPLRVGYYLRLSFREGILNRIVPYNPGRHITDVYAALGRSIGVEAAGAGEPRLRPGAWDAARLRDLLDRHGIGADEPLILLSVASSGLCDERRWPADRFAWLSDRLAESGRVVYIGAPKERPQVEEVRALCARKSLNLAGETDLGTLIALLERARVVVANDGGPAHMADAVGAPLVALYGPESPAHYGPLGPRTVALHAGLYCSPCLSAANTKTAPCGGRNACMQAIPREDVLVAARLLLDGLPVPPELRDLWRGYGGRHAHRDWRSVIPA